ncbi:unnamed protein product [Rhizophagus irregularis]|uniref:SCO1 protein n=1 Tax=Rhizophagus irregularis TaxID=588596 RepID=A0A2I1FUD7_9GLOM|nr:SCO1 protein [Rhizophagus irregularis]CAB4422862.1 unnamed protein product [Rhizophagus irregularis]
MNSAVKRIGNSYSVYRNQYYLRNINTLNNKSQNFFNPRFLNKNVTGGKVRYNSASSQKQQQTPPKNVGFEETLRDRYTVGPFNWKSLVLFIVTGTGLFFYFKNEKKKVLEKRKEELANKSIGRPKVGGPFELINQDGKLVTDKDFLGKFLLVYFGFTHCPDICPEELDKMSKVTDIINNSEEFGRSKVIIPIFITCDPERDSVEVVRKYLEDFHKDMVGLTGSHEQLSKVAKSYRVYFSKPPKLQPGEEYLVDHSIFFYLMNPDGEFVDVYGKNLDAEQVSTNIIRHAKDFLKKGGIITTD